MGPVRGRGRWCLRALALSDRGSGPAFGLELTGAEVHYLMAKEWARFPDDVLWRRSKLGLTMPPGDRDALAAFMATPGRDRADDADPGIPKGARSVTDGVDDDLP